MVTYGYRWIITRSGVVKQKRYRISSDFELKKTKQEKEKEIIRQLLIKRNKEHAKKKEMQRRYKHELFLRRLDKTAKEKTYGCYCMHCRKVRAITSPEFSIVHSSIGHFLRVTGKCIYCKRQTISKIIRKATENDIKALD